MNNSYDIIVIGAGHNGLTTACRLAQKGKKVIVLEKRDVPGGIASGEEFHTSYRTIGLLHDTSSVRTAIINQLNLKSVGLKSLSKRAPVTFLGKNGKQVTLEADIEKAVMEIAKFSENDAEAYRKYHEFINRIRPFIRSLMDEIPPDLMELELKQLIVLAKKGFALRRLGKKTMLEFLKVAPMSVADFLNETFETDYLKAALSAPAIYGSFNGPWASYTTLNLLLWECQSEEHIVGGPQALIKALEQSATELGVEIRLNSAIKEILIDDVNKVTGVELVSGEKISATIISASCTAKETFLNLIPAFKIDYSLETSILHYRSRGTTSKIHLALDYIPLFNSNSADDFQYFRTGNSFDDMEKAFDPVKYRNFSTEPILDICLIKSDDNCPKNHSVLSILVHFAAYDLEETWTDKSTDKLFESVIKTLEFYINDITSHIVAKEILSPSDLEKRYTLTEGHIFHGEHAIDQLITRPVPLCAQYETPISGLYLSGSSSHPGGGITCVPGYLSAEAILKK